MAILEPKAPYFIPRSKTLADNEAFFYIKNYSWCDFREKLEHKH